MGRPPILTDDVKTHIAEIKLANPQMNIGIKHKVMLIFCFIPLSLYSFL